MTTDGFPDTEPVQHAQDRVAAQEETRRKTYTLTELTARAMALDHERSELIATHGLAAVQEALSGLLTLCPTVTALRWYQASGGPGASGVEILASYVTTTPPTELVFEANEDDRRFCLWWRRESQFAEFLFDHEAVLATLFGDHARVTAMRGALQVDEFHYHD